MTTFQAQGEFSGTAEEIARPVGLTAAWWTVLGSVYRDPMTVAAIARAVGLKRQSVQRVATCLVEQGWVEYRDNPADRRAQLLIATDSGRAAIGRLSAAQARWANAVADGLSEHDLDITLKTLTAVISRSRSYREAD